MTKTVLTLNKQLESARCSIRYNYILFPNVFDIYPILIKRGFTLPSPLLQQIRPGIRFDGKGPIAQKDTLIFECNTDKQVFSLSGNTIKTVCDELNELNKIMNDMTSFSNDKIIFYEIQAGFTFKITEKAIINQFKKYFSSSKLNKNAIKHFDRKMSLFSLRLFDEKNLPESPDYFEITIEPHPLPPYNLLNIIVIYRHHKINEFILFTKEIEKRIIAYIESLFE